MANQIERRGFFGMLFGAPTAAQILSEIPGVSKVEKIQSGGEAAFVLSHPEHLCDSAFDNRRGLQTGSAQ